MMPDQMQTTIGYYDLGKTLYDEDATITVHQFETDALVKARTIATGEISEMPAHLLKPHLHTIFLDGKESNIRNLAARYLGYGDSEASREPVEESKGKGKDTNPSTKRSKSKASKRDGCG